MVYTNFINLSMNKVCNLHLKNWKFLIIQELRNPLINEKAYFMDFQIHKVR